MSEYSATGWLTFSRCVRFATLPSTAALVYFAHLWLGPLGRAMLFAVTGALVVAHIIGAVARVLLGQWKVPGIRRYLAVELLLGILVPFLVFAVAFKLPTSVPALCVIAALLFYVNGLYSSLEKTLTREVRADDEATLLSEWIGRCQPHRLITGDERRVEKVDYRKEAIGLLKVLAYLTQPVRGNAYCRMRALFLTLITCAAMIAVNSAVANEAHDLAGKDGGASETNMSEGDGTGATKTGGGEEVGVDEKVKGDDTSGEEDPEEECELDLKGAPRWARADLRELYLGDPELEATAPPGFGIGGCPGVPVVRLEGSFVYLVGRHAGGEVASVAVDSLAFGPEIFVAPAAKHVLELIEEGMEPVGGHPRLFPDGGDAVTIETPRGTIVAVRGAEHPVGRPSIAIPYIELPPSVAMAWMGAMGEVERWLWPLRVRHSAGEVVFPLAASKEGPELYEIEYDLDTHVATRDGYVYPARQTQLGYSELKAWALGAGADGASRR